MWRFRCTVLECTVEAGAASYWAEMRVGVVLLLTAAAAAQSAGQRFDAVSIHELEGPYRVLGQLTVSGSLVRLEGYTIGMLVAEAYGKKRYQTATMQNEVQPTDIAIQDSVRRLGLQLEKRDEQMEVVVVDSYDDLPSAH